MVACIKGLQKEGICMHPLIGIFYIKNEAYVQHSYGNFIDKLFNCRYAAPVPGMFCCSKKIQIW